MSNMGFQRKPFPETVFSFERRDLLCSHSNGDIFTCENNMLFSRVKISCFRAKAHLVFHWCLYDNIIYFLPGLTKSLGLVDFQTGQETIKTCLTNGERSRHLIF